jgi:flagellar hook-length control protein FliK
VSSVQSPLSPDKLLRGPRIGAVRTLAPEARAFRLPEAEQQQGIRAADHSAARDAHQSKLDRADDARAPKNRDEKRIGKDDDNQNSGIRAALGKQRSVAQALADAVRTNVSDESTPANTAESTAQRAAPEENVTEKQAAELKPETSTDAPLATEQFTVEVALTVLPPLTVAAEKTDAASLAAANSGLGGAQSALASGSNPPADMLLNDQMQAANALSNGVAAAGLMQQGALVGAGLNGAADTAATVGTIGSVATDGVAQANLLAGLRAVDQKAGAATAFDVSIGATGAKDEKADAAAASAVATKSDFAEALQKGASEAKPGTSETRFADALQQQRGEAAQPSLIALPAPAGALLTGATDAMADPRTARVPETRPTPINAVPMEIGFRALQGQKRFDIRLDPGDLGRVDVRLEIGDDGAVSARLTVDRVETLHLLQRDARTLEQAFEQAGLKPTDSSVEIQLRDRSMDFGGSPNRQQPDDGPQRVIRAAIADDDAQTALHPAMTRIHRAATSGVDIVI